MSIHSDTRRYEAWLRKQCDVVEPALTRKHKRMRKNAFTFLRATYYRWAKKIEVWCPDLADAPEVRAVGDAHTENFGTWRDSEGRLVWGINDFDEAALMPYPLDLVRLTVSAALAPDRRLSPHDACAAILRGYVAGLIEPRPTLLDEQELWMRPLVSCSDDDRKEFWREVSRYPDVEPPRKAALGLQRSLPKHANITRFSTRMKGGGGLGRPRYIAEAEWRGGDVVREAKALVPSAWDWARDRSPDRTVLLKLARGKFRSPDPFLDTDGHFIYRRIAADSRKVELGDNAGTRLSRNLLKAMGFDLGAIHAAHSMRAKEIETDLKRRSPDWLMAATEKTAAAVHKEYKVWKRKRKETY
jgi:uncharacterized protein DUF2252